MWEESLTASQRKAWNYRQRSVTRPTHWAPAQIFLTPNIQLIHLTLCSSEMFFSFITLGCKLCSKQDQISMNYGQEAKKINGTFQSVWQCVLRKNLKRKYVYWAEIIFAGNGHLSAVREQKPHNTHSVPSFSIIPLPISHAAMWLLCIRFQWENDYIFLHGWQCRLLA